MKLLRSLSLTSTLVLGLPAALAHEFWLEPSVYSAKAGTSVALALRVGEDFRGELRPFTRARVAALRHYTADGMTDTLAKVPGSGETPALDFTLTRPGTQVFAMDSTPSTIVLSADKFTAYLHSDGLEHIAKLRQAAGNENSPGRERYRRCVKTLLRVGEKSDGTFAVRTGQRLEIVPDSDPLAAKAGARISFKLYFEQRPLAHALVQAWHHRDQAQLHVIKSRSNLEGSVTFDLPYAGPWMLSVVHMVPLQNVAEADWESLWGNLTFALNP